MSRPINRRPIFIFLTLTFVATGLFLLASQYFLSHLSGALDRAIIAQLLLLLGMFIPAASAIIVQRRLMRRPVHDLGWRLGPWSLYLRSYATIAFAFVINYGLTWAFVIPSDWTLANFLDRYASLPLPLPAPLLLLLLPLLTFIFAPIINMIPALGEEIGWRGFLLPALAPLGKAWAIIISAGIWSLWHLPMLMILGFSGAQAWTGILLNFLMIFGFGLWLGYVWLKTESTILTAFMHATFNAGSYTFWLLIFTSGSRLLLRSAGLAGTLVLLLFGLYGLYFLLRKSSFKLPL